MELFFCYLVILIKECKIPYKDSGKALLFSRNEVFCLKNSKIWRVLTTIAFNIFCWNFAHFSCLPITKRGCSRFYLFLLRSWVICQNKKTLFLNTHKNHFWLFETIWDYLIQSGRGDESFPPHIKNVITFERLMVLTWNFVAFLKLSWP